MAINRLTSLVYIYFGYTLPFVNVSTNGH